MSFDQNELRAQRDRIRAHLAWLDAQIAKAEDLPPAKAPQAQAPLPAADPALAATAAVTPTAVQAESAAPSYTPDPQAYVGEKASNSKVGCIAMAAFACLLVIFLLFGLPYLRPLSEFEQANVDLVESFTGEVAAVRTLEQRREVNAELSAELMEQKRLMQIYRDNKQGASKDAQSTLRTINALEALQEELRNIALDAPAASGNSAG